MSKKRQADEVVDCLPRSDSSKTVTSESVKFQSLAVLDYVLAHAQGDQRPFLNVNIFGKTLLGLLDSGASRTIVGSAGWSILKSLCTLQSCEIPQCTVANGQSCVVLGTVPLPISLQDRVILLDVLVVPELPFTLILGIDFWTKMRIVPDMFSGEWTFADRAGHDRVELAAIQSASSLSVLQREILETLIGEIFPPGGSKLGCTTLVELVIKTNSPPIKQRYYPLSKALQTEVNSELEQMLADDIIEPSESPWSSPIVMIKKKTGGWRFCVDYRQLNKATVPDAYPIPYVSATLDKLRDARYLSTLDIKSAYWQIPVSKESRPLTAFTVPSRGLFQFKRMPFGLTNAPAVWQRLIDRVVGVDLEKNVFVYLDDVIICTSTFDEHIRVLREVISRVTKAGLTLNRDKCNFVKSELKYLGYIVNASGLLVDPAKIDAILQIPTPKNVSDIRRIVGLASWYRRFVPNFSTVISPLTRLTCKNARFVWDSDCETAFNMIKEHLIKAPVLSCPDFDQSFCIQCDASDFGLGAVLSQVQDGVEHVICYLSRSLNKNERRYTTTEKECLAVLFAVEKFRPYIEGARFTVITDHYSLKWLNSIKDPVGRIARWAVRLQQYDFEIIHRKGKENVVPDALSRSVPVVDTITDKLQLPITAEDCDQDKWYSGMVDKVKKSPVNYPLWRVDDHFLFKRVHTKYEELLEPENRWLIVVPRRSRITVIRNHHCPPTCGHLGVFKTTNRIMQSYYWPGIKSDVARFIARCDTCLKTKPVQKAPAGQMLSQQPAASRPFQIISVDLVGPLPRSTSGYRYVLSVLDVFSKFVLFFPLRSATAPGIVKWLEEHVILVYGIPQKLILDNGPQFRSRQFKELMNHYGIQPRFTAYYHPQANPVERVHRVLKSIISSYVGDNHRTWDRLLARAGCAIRSAKHEVTALTPNFVVFGRELNFVSTDGPAHGTLPSVFDPVGRSRILETVFVDVQKKLRQAYDRTRVRYNLRRRGDKFEINQEVWHKNYVLSNAAEKFTSKFAPKFVGPFVISKVMSPWTYQLSDHKGRVHGIWHAKDLKLHPPDALDKEAIMSLE